MKLPDLSVLYEDNHLLAVNKPAGVLTQAYESDRDSLEVLARQWVKIKRNKPGNVFLHTVGRLDGAVSGIVLFARTGKALSRMNAAVRERQLLKIYHAVVAGSPEEKGGILKHYIRHGSHRARITGPGARDAKEAVLEYRLVKKSGGASLLEVRLHTGRYHQIRAQLAAIGTPILGDRRYGGSQGDLPADAIALHHVLLELDHPVRGEPVRIEAPYPPHWPAAFQNLRSRTRSR